jgi:hypothetical protein
VPVGHSFLVLVLSGPWLDAASASKVPRRADVGAGLPQAGRLTAAHSDFS